MGTPPLPFYTLTPAAAQQRLLNDGLGTLGLTAVALSPHWATANISTYDPVSRTLTSPGQLRAPFRGIMHGAFAPADSVLAVPAGKNAGSLTVAPGDGGKFPVPAANTSVVLTISDASGSRREIVACTGVVGDTLQVQRGYEGSAAQDFDAGDRVTLRLGRHQRSIQFSDAGGQPLAMTCAVFRFHPQAALRLERLMAARYEAGTPSPIRPVPHALVIWNAGFFLTDQFFEPDDMLLGNGAFQFSFHDARGLIVDPVYVAAVFNDLLGSRPALRPPGVTGTVNDPGGVAGVAGLATGTLVHVASLHGGTFQPVTSGLVTGTGNQTTPVPASGFVDPLPPGAAIKAATVDTPLRWGWATNGVMTANDLMPPPLPQGVTLSREFFRVFAVDTRWALLGNRTGGMVLGVQKDDGRIPAEFLPEVRDQVVVDYLVDGPDTLAEIDRVLQPAPPKDLMLSVSSLWDDSMLVPAQLGPNAHWPAFPPAANPPPQMPPGVPAQVPAALPPGAVTAAPSAQNPQDVVATLTGVAPFDAHVRIYPQRFVTIEAIGAEPSFVRGDGGAAIAGAGPVSVLLPNPFGLLPNQTLPSQLTMDIVIAPRMGGRRLFGAVQATIAGPAVSPPASPFTGPAPVLPVPAMLQGIAPSPLFGVPVPPNPPAPDTSSFTALLLSFVADSMPRQAPRLPTQARFETMGASGAPGGANGTDLWDAVVTGGRWAAESRSAQHQLGNPGNPAGPDVHAPGVRVTGALAYDVGYVALRRAEPMIPWPGSVQNFPGWVVFSIGNNFNAPDDSGNVGNTGTGVVLRTIARACESSLLSEQAIPTDDDLNQQNWLNQLLQALQIPVSINVTLQNEQRLRKEVRREFYISKHGLRDAQWSLLRALSEARELIYIESPQFARTARPGQPPQDYEVDLVQVIAARLQQAPDLKVIVCTPRLSDFMPQFKSWAHQHYAARTEAAGTLLSAARDRVVLFHPGGFPGRPCFIRTTSVIVDDVWALVGATHFRRRGMTFDGSVAVASLDRQIENGYSKKVRDYRRALMAQKLRVPAPLANLAPPADWVRLGRPDGAFALVQDWLAQGGLGRLEPLWPGPEDNVLAQDPDVADPDGSTSDKYLWMTTLGGVLNEAGD